MTNCYDGILKSFQLVTSQIWQNNFVFNFILVRPRTFQQSLIGLRLQSRYSSQEKKEEIYIYILNHNENSLKLSVYCKTTNENGLIKFYFYCPLCDHVILFRQFIFLGLSQFKIFIFFTYLPFQRSKYEQKLDSFYYLNKKYYASYSFSKKIFKTK